MKSYWITPTLKSVFGIPFVSLVFVLFAPVYFIAGAIGGGLSGCIHLYEELKLCFVDARRG